MKYTILRGLFASFLIFCYSQIDCKKNRGKKTSPVKTTPENAFDSHLSAIRSDEWENNEFLNITPGESKYMIADVLDKYMDNNTFFLELASGNEERITHFAERFPYVTFQPTDYEDDPNGDNRLEKVPHNLSNILEPINVDVRSPSREWFDGGIKEESVHYMFVANLLQGATLKLATGIFEGAARYLRPGGFLFMYGPFKMQGKIFGDENVKLDRELRKKNYLWGLREVWGELNEEAFDVGLYLEMLYKLPNYYQILSWKKDEIMQYHLDESKIPVKQAIAETANYLDDDIDDETVNVNQTFTYPMAPTTKNW